MSNWNSDFWQRVEERTEYAQNTREVAQIVREELKGNTDKWADCEVCEQAITGDQYRTARWTGHGDAHDECYRETRKR